MKTFNQFVDEGVLTAIGKKKPEKKAEKAMDAGARARRKVARRVHAKYVSGSEDLVPDSIREGMIDVIKKGAKRHSKAVEKKKIKNRKAVPYAALAAEHTPEGEVLDERQKTNQGERQSEASGRSDYSKASIRNKRKFGKAGEPAVFDLPFSGGPSERGKMITQRRTEHKARRGVKTKGVTEDYYSGTGEKVQKRTKAWMDKKGQKGAPGLDAMKARTAEHKAKRGVKEEVVDEGLGASMAVTAGLNAVGNIAKAYGASQAAKGAIVGGALSGAGALAGGALNYAASRNKNKKSESKKKKMKEDKAFNFVLDKIRKEVGKDGYVSKDNPRKPQSAADKAKARAHQAKVDKENAAERKKDPSQGRYPKG